MIYDNLESEISNALPQLHPFTGFDTCSYKFNIGRVYVFKNFCKDPSSLIFIKILRLIITMIEKFAHKAKVFVQTIIYNEKYVSIRA